MAKIDDIVQQIRNAKAEAIHTGNYSDERAAKILQKNIAAQQSAKSDNSASTGQAETPALPEVKDTRPTQQKYDDAKKAYDDYVGSAEYWQRLAEANKPAHTTTASDVPIGVKVPADSKKQELKAMVEHYKRQMDEEESQRIRDTDMKEIDAMSEEDREQLRQYISSYSKTGNLLVNSNPLLWFKENKALGDSSKYLFGKYGEEKTKQLASSYSRYLNEEEAKKISEDTKEAVNKSAMSAIGHNILGVGTRLFGGLQATADRFVEALDRDERYPTLAPVTSGDLISLHGNTVTAQTAQNIAGDVFDQNGQQVKDGGVLRQGAAFLYQGGMTMVDSFARAAAGGGSVGAAAIAACNAFSQTVSQASQQGASPQQAYTLGAAVAGIEYLSEKIPMDEIFKLAKAGDTKVLAQAFRQTGIEISTEELSYIGSMVAEAAILREKSSYKQQIGDLVANGASYEEAKAQADKAVWEEVKQTAYVSGIAGGFSGGGAAIVGNLTTNNAPEVTEEVQQEQPVQTPPEAPAVDEGQQIVDAVAAELAQQAPQQEAQPVTPEMEQLDMAIAETLGVQPAQQPTVDTAPAAEYDNSNVSPSLGASVGNSGVTYTSDNQAVPFQYAVVPAESLITSNDQFGNVNSAYPAELQPRDRTRAASQTQINSISRNLNPALLAESPTAQNGAPIIRGDGVVIGGNGRVSAITQAYGAGRGAEYQQYITQRAAELGIDPATLPANPVLVRITNGVDNYTGLATALNETGVKTNSPSETAKIDASKMGDIIQYLSVGEDGDLNTAENREFIQQFTTHVVPSGEQDTVMQGNSQVSQAGVRRMQYALFHYAYNDTALLERLAESTDNNAKNITNAMVGTAGKVAQLQTEIGRGEVQDFGLQSAITNAVNLYLDAKAGKQTVDDAAGQLTMGDNGPEAQHDGLTVNLAKFMEANNRSGKQIRDFIDILVDVNMNMAAETATEVSMFDTGDQQTQEGLYDEAVTAYDQQRDGKGRIPEKSDFSQYRQYQPGELAGSMDGGGTEGDSGKAQLYGRSTEPVPTAAPGGQRNLTEQNPGIKGTGAAEGNFSGKPAYNATLSEDNSQADRRDDVRPMELPRRDINGNNISAVTGNVYGAGVTPDEFASLMEEPTARGDFSYVPISNNEATQQAMENITRYGWQDAYTQWSNAVHQGRAGAEMSARGALFLNHAAQAGDRQQWLNILSDFQRLGTNTAQGLQAFRILRNLAPSDRLYLMRRSVAQMVEDMHLNVPIEIDQQLADQYQSAPTNEEADAILDEIIDDVAAQIPSTAADRWTALRYVNMLGNLRTQARNISGNIGAKFTYLAKDQIGAALEKVAHAFNPDFQRTKSAWVSNELKALGRADFDEVRDIVLENGRFDDARRFDSTYFAREVNERRRIFRNGFMESYRRLTNWAMNNDHFGDAGFAKAAYARALGGYLKANGFTGDTLEGIDQNLLDDARLYAIQQAQESTFRDHNAVSDWVGRIGRRQDTPRAIRTLSEGVMPFRSTPANVLVRAEEFSPLGIINTAVTAARAANPDSDVTGTDVVESMAKTLTGTGLFIMGAYLGKMGMLAGGPDPDEEQAEFDKMNGYQNYALQLGDGRNITIDFLSPLAVPMFLGAELEKIISDGGYDLADFEKVFTSLADPLIQMSMLQGLNDTLDGIKYSENNLGQFFLNASMSYLTQGLTNTLMGQLERSSEENRMTTFVDKGSAVPQWMQQQLGKMSQKIPGWDYQQAEYLNAWGETQKNEGGLTYNLLSPGYISTERSDPITKELNRLREVTGENVFPQTVDKSVNFTDTDGVTHTGYNLSQKELETMQKVEGQTAHRLAAEVIMNQDYAGLTDKQKAEVMDNIYAYAQEEARKQALPKYYSEAPAWMRELGEESADGLIRRAALSTINTAVNNTVDNIENGWAVTPAATQDLNALFDAYDSMSKEAKQKILDDAISDTAKYLEIRSRGISTDQYLDVVTDIKALKPEPTFTNIRDIQTREAIAHNDSLSDKEKDYVMKAYMTDYDPTAKSPQTTELKYDEIRKLGVSPEGYTAAYRDYLDASGTGKRRRTIAHYMKTYGWDRSTAQKVYDLYAGYWKPWKE